MTLEVEGVAQAERAIAEAFSAGASGLEEHAASGTGILVLSVYAPQTRAAAVREALQAALGPQLCLGPDQVLEPVDWSNAWREDLRPLVISPRLLVCPVSLQVKTAEGQQRLWIEYGQAFGTGRHASTRLALELLDGCLPALPQARLLDVGTGSGILAIAALLLGATSAIGFDLDLLAAPAAHRNARRNRVETRLGLFTGPLAALSPGVRGFDVVCANLLRSELLPLLPPLAACVRRGGHAVFSGLLASEEAGLVAQLEAHGLRPIAARYAEDGGERWLGLLTQR